MGLDFPRNVTIVEVGPRDGLQNESDYVPTDQKIALIDALSETGLKRIQVTSFVSPKRVPQLRDAVEVVKSIRREPGMVHSALVPNLVGLNLAIEAGIEEIEVFLSASESHNLLNVNKPIVEWIEALGPICEGARQRGIATRASISTSFGCSIEGAVAPQMVVDIAARLAGMGVAEIALGDTVGMANPSQAYALFSRVLDALPDTRFAAHFHDTRGAGLANALAALQAGITVFDASIGGMGGCPNTPGAAGNVATEDLVYMFEEMGVSTGIDVCKLAECAKLAEKIVGHSLPGKLGKAGLCSQ